MKWKAIIPDMLWFFGSIFVMVFSLSAPEAVLEAVPEPVFYIVALAAFLMIYLSGRQMMYKIAAAADTKSSDLIVNGMYHDIAKPSPEFIEKDQQVPVHETVLDKMCTPSLIFAPKLNFTVTFQPEADKCTFLISNGYSCTAAAVMATEKGYYIHWNTLSWNAPLEGRLSKEDKKLVAEAFAKVDKDSIVWPFTKEKVSILTTRHTYY